MSKRELIMKKLISAKFAGKSLLVMLILLSIFHVLVLVGVIPSDFIWGGQIDGNIKNLYTLEIISLAVTIMFIFITIIKNRSLISEKNVKLINIFVWVIFAYMLLNTLGNLASGVSTEKLIFTPISLLIAFFSLRLALEK